MVEIRPIRPEELPAFQGLGYRYDEERSTRGRLVFLRDNARGKG